MVRTNKSTTIGATRFAYHLQKARQQTLARKQKAAKEREEALEELKEDREFARVHERMQRLSGGTKSNDPIQNDLKRLDRLTTQLQKQLVAEDPSYAAE